MTIATRRIAPSPSASLTQRNLDVARYMDAYRVRYRRVATASDVAAHFRQSEQWAREQIARLTAMKAIKGYGA